jgi:putative redox protein
MIELQVEHLGGVQFEVKARKHMLICDQPAENEGYDEGMTPPELLLASLGTCAGFYAAQYLKKHKLCSEGTRVRVSAEKASAPARLASFHIAVDVPLQLGEKHQKGIEDAVHHCLIHNTLLYTPEITLHVASAVVAV